MFVGRSPDYVSTLYSRLLLLQLIYFFVNPGYDYDWTRFVVMVQFFSVNSLQTSGSCFYNDLVIEKNIQATFETISTM